MSFDMSVVASRKDTKINVYMDGQHSVKTVRR
jgi:hypothetical protein